ncbi:aromatic acid exporter family protein [Paenibacillus sp. GSMTC-2017]|uniref:aromatic acid exporter family protein n=1 Tax=Paenibacillus sp. GSMTC-2017 TaxID=2794350 RepID=UPI0018D8B8DE|nr:aromatic acid exporter family protein [Paenibacillus sp. GSMTC-2017]MBH5317807.1 aromatic acid exporter family protein [Paenibacillus sp. GSMTC-2017]
MGIRVIKTAVAAIAAIYLALYLGLEPALSAGMLAILGVEVTRMKGLRSALIRFVASVLGLFFASFIFTLFGFEYWSVAIFILITFPVLSRFNLKDGIVTSSVIVFHLFTFGEVTVHNISNEIFLLLVGLGCATAINFLYMPKDEKVISTIRNETEQYFATIFTEMANTLRDPKHIWNGSELLDAHQAIEDGSARSIRNRENRPWGYETYWSTYFEMRRQQLDTIQQMIAELALVYEKLPQAELIAKLLDQLSNDVKSDVYQGLAEQGVFQLMVDFRAMDLPKTRDEFELRAALLTLLHEIDRYLAIAKRLKKKAVLPKKGVA